MDRSLRPPVWLLAVFAVIAAAAALAASSPVPGVSVDSGEYLAVAESFHQGRGLTMPYVGYDESFRVLERGERVPMTQFPPLYPATLAVLLDVGLPRFVAVRLLGAASLAVLIVLGMYLVWRATEHGWPAVLAGLLLLSPSVVTIHSMAWSEQLMLVALTGCLLASEIYARSGTARSLVAMGACAVIASMARFAGVSAVIACTAVILMHREHPLARRTLRATALTMLAMAPTIAWFVRNSLVTGTVSEKQPGWHPPTLQVLGQGLQSIGGWVAPWRLATMTTGSVVVAITVGMAIRYRRRLRDLRGRSVPALCAVFGAAYTVFLLVARTLLDQNIPFDDRLLAPLLVLAVIGLCSLLWKGPASVHWLLSIVLVILAVASIARTTAMVARFSGTTVAAYTSDEWRSSELVAYVRTLPRSTAIITNAPDPLWLWDDRTPQILPPRSSLYSGEANANYSKEVNDVLEATRCRRAVVAFFYQPTRKPPREIDPLIVTGLRLEASASFGDGQAFEVDEPPCTEKHG